MKHILYIEDNLPTQMLVKRQLTSLGEVLGAFDLAAGKRLLSERKFDLLVSDVYLPDGNALEFVRELRTRFSPERLPVILTSSSMDQLLRVQSLRAGANDCFAMPCPWTVLLEAVGRMLVRPYVRSPGLEAVTATWVEGMTEDRHWLFCPELNVHLEGDSPEALRSAMAERVRVAVAGGAVLPFTSRVKVTEQLVMLTPPPKAPGEAGC